MAGGNFTNVFGGQVVRPSQLSYQSITMSSNTTLLWPTESLEGAVYVASEIDVTATATHLALLMPSALIAATGPATTITNVGTNTFSVADNTGNTIVNIASGQAWIITLTSNTTQAGTWRTLQLGSTTTSAVASQLADGITTQATTLNTLQVAEFVNTYSNSALLTAAVRGGCSVLASGSAASTFQMDLIFNLGAGWYQDIVNLSGNTLTLSGSSVQLLNSAPTFAMSAGSSARVIAGASSFTVINNVNVSAFGVVNSVLGGSGILASGSTVITVSVIDNYMELAPIWWR